MSALNYNAQDIGRAKIVVRSTACEENVTMLEAPVQGL